MERGKKMTEEFFKKFPGLRGKETRSWITDSSNKEYTFFDSRDIEENCIGKIKKKEVK